MALKTSRTEVRSVFRPRSAEGVELCHPNDAGEFETISLLFNGQPRAQEWRPIRMKLIRSDESGRALSESDAPWLGSHALIFKPRALTAMRDLLEANGEFLPLECAEADLVIFNPLRVLDALDETASDVKRFSGSGKIFIIRRHVFHAGRLHAVAFKISSLRVSPTYVTASFVERWQQAGLRGLSFEPVWEAGI